LSRNRCSVWPKSPFGFTRFPQFFSLGELNVAIAEQVRLVNERPFRGQTISRRALFEELERDALQPLPPTRYEIALWKPAKVNIDYHVEYDTRFYSVPHRLVHEPVEVRATAAVVEIFHRSRRVASHVREYGRKRFITDPEHMPAAHRAHLEWTPSKLIAWGRSVGPAVAELTAPGTWLSGVHGPQTFGQALRSRALDRRLPARAGHPCDLVQQRAGHFEEQPGPGTGCRGSAGQGGAHPPCQSELSS